MSRSKGIFTVSPFTNPSGTTSWRVVGTKLDGTRVRLSYPAEAVARATKNDLEREALNEGSPQKLLATTLSPQQLRLAELAFEKVPEDEFLAALDYWCQHGRVREQSTAPNVSGAAEAFIKWLETTTSLRPHSKSNLRNRVNFFATTYGAYRLADIDPEHIQSFVDSFDVTATTRDNIKRALSRFFSWCIERQRRWIKFNPCREIIIEQAEKGPPAILTVEECEALLRAAEKLKHGRLVPFITLCLFAGLRPASEAKRLTWQQINLTDKELRVEGSHTKTTGRSRVFELVPTLRGRGKPHPGPDTIVRWLTAYKAKPLFPKNWRRDFDALKAAIGYGGRPKDGELLRPWPVDIMRHTAISHYIRLTGSYGQAAEQFGNSESIIKKNYQGRVSSADTAKFYAILPTKRVRKKGGNVIDFPTDQTTASAPSRPRSSIAAKAQLQSPASP